MPLEKQGNFTFNHSDQPDDLYNSKTASEIKQAFDSRADELKDTVNAIVDLLQSVVDGDSGADNVKATAIAGLTGSTVQGLLEALKSNDDSILSQIHDVVLGQISDGTITDIKLSDAEGQIKQTVSEHLADDAIDAHNAGNISVTDTAGHFTATDVEGALSELFQNVSDGKSQVSTAITDKGGTVVDTTGTGVPAFGDLVTGVGTIPVGGGPNGSQSFTSPGAVSFTVPAGIVRLDVALWGGGGSGGNGSGYSYGFGGGGGGEFIFGTLDVTPGQVLTGIVGAGGITSGSSGSAGTPGGDTTLGVLTAKGGGYGQGGFGSGGTGGGISDSSKGRVIIDVPGASGGNHSGSIATGSGGGGAGGAGGYPQQPPINTTTAGLGSPASAIIRAGGNGGAGGGSGVKGNNGLFPGGAGGGTGANAPAGGGNGAGGCIDIYW